MVKFKSTIDDLQVTNLDLQFKKLCRQIVGKWQIEVEL